VEHPDFGTFCARLTADRALAELFNQTTDVAMGARSLPLDEHPARVERVHELGVEVTQGFVCLSEQQYKDRVHVPGVTPALANELGSKVVHGEIGPPRKDMSHVAISKRL